MRSTVLVLAAGVSLYMPRPAEACSPPPCFGGAFLPGDQGHVPANAPGLLWRAMFDYEAQPDPTKVVLTSAADPATPIAFTARPLADHEFLLTPDAPLAPGSYVITDHTVCGDAGAASGPRVAFTVTPAAAMPTSLGTLAALGPSRLQIDLLSRSGSCSSKAIVDATTLELSPSNDALPWLDLLEFSTLVDGAFWQYQTGLDFMRPPGESALGRGRDRVYQVCSSMDPTVSGLAAGKHVVKLIAGLPGITQGVASEPHEVTVRCDVNGDPSGGGSNGGDPTAEPRPGGGCNAGAGAGPGLGLALLALLRGARRRDRDVRRGTAQRRCA